MKNSESEHQGRVFLYSPPPSGSFFLGCASHSSETPFTWYHKKIDRGRRELGGFSYLSLYRKKNIASRFIFPPPRFSCLSFPPFYHHLSLFTIVNNCNFRYGGLAF